MIFNHRHALMYSLILFYLQMLIIYTRSTKVRLNLVIYLRLGS